MKVQEEKKDLTCAFCIFSLVLMVQYQYCMSLFQVIFLGSVSRALAFLSHVKYFLTLSVVRLKSPVLLPTSGPSGPI